MVEHKKIILKLEQQALCFNEFPLLNKWMIEVVNAEHNVMMAVTEKAKSKTLNSLVFGYNLGDPNRNYDRLKSLSLVRKEIVRQQKIKLSKVERFMKEYIAKTT